jgi:hypothetical protein
MINILNCGPVEWFSPHFAYTDNRIRAFEFDTLKNDTLNIDCFIQKNGIQLLQVFRGDLIRSELKKFTTPYLEWSTEIYPHSEKILGESDIIPWEKLFHCLKNHKSDIPILHYDESRIGFLTSLGIPVIPSLLGVNMKYFKKTHRDIDVLFFGRASNRRLDFLRHFKEKKFSFVWIENGLKWSELSQFLSRSKVILNLSADGNDNFEPRILLGIAAGCTVITEKSLGLEIFKKSNKVSDFVKSRIFEFDHVSDALELSTLNLEKFIDNGFDYSFDSNKILIQNMYY